MSFVLTAGVLFGGCTIFSESGPSGKDPAGETGGEAEADPFVMATEAATSDRNGTFEVEIQVGPDTEAFQVVAATTTRFMVATEYLVDPDGDLVLDWKDWYNSDNNLTSAFYPTENANTFNWPVRAEDGPLKQGKWTWAGATVAPSGNYESGVELDVTVMSRPDADLEAGRLNAYVAYARGLQDDAELVTAIETAAAYWQEIYAEAGIELTLTYTTLDVDPELPYTYEGLEEYQTLMEEIGERGVLMVIGDSIGGHAALYGEAGGIPGPYLPQPHGAVELAWITHAGGNGNFSEDEIALMGETMAHEVGHYLGLFHPVEYTWDWWDALDDTQDCRSWSTCEEALGENLMFPYPVCYGRDCLRQNDVSGEQRGVAHRYVGVEE